MSQNNIETAESGIISYISTHLDTYIDSLNSTISDGVPLAHLVYSESSFPDASNPYTLTAYWTNLDFDVFGEYGNYTLTDNCDVYITMVGSDEVSTRKTLKRYADAFFNLMRADNTLGDSVVYSAISGFEFRQDILEAVLVITIKATYTIQ